MISTSTENQQNFDVIIAGAGSIGTPCAFFLAKAGLKTLVIETLPSTGQLSNKHAIGGIRATHSDPSKIYLCTRSLAHFSNWEKQYGDDIEWHKGGYSFVAYTIEIEQILKSLLSSQKKLGLNIDWLEKEDIKKIIPDLNNNDLRGGTFSPDDGSASPLKSSYAFYKQAKNLGAEFYFNETITAVEHKAGKVHKIITNKSSYSCSVFINAAGSKASHISNMVGIEIPVKPDAHEAGITEAVNHMFDPMLVDIRPRSLSSNFYFYQHPTGKIIFCITPNPQIWGENTLSTSEFLPLAAKRLIEIMPKLKNIRVRRTWRGTYPMTPDGSPILGKVKELEGYLLAVGMCGQGFMLGPGVGELMANLVTEQLCEIERETLDSLSLYRQFASTEQLK